MLKKPAEEFLLVSTNSPYESSIYISMQSKLLAGFRLSIPVKGFGLKRGAD